MLDDYVNQSNLIDLVESETEGDEGESRVWQGTLKVLNEKRWIRMMVELLECAHEEDGFDLEPRKAFWWCEDKGKARFSWVLLVWGDLEIAAAAIGSILSTRYEPKPPPPKTEDPRKRPSVKRTLKTRKVPSMDGEGSRLVTTARLPHAKRGRYENDPHQIVKVRAGKGSRVRAAVSSGAGFTPKATKDQL